jgi:hypothetical protein
MIGMSMPQADEEDAGFPAHTTRYPLSMIPMHEHLRLNEHSPDEGIAAESVIADGNTTLNPRLLLIPDDLADRAEPLTEKGVRGLRDRDTPEQRATERALDENIRQ